MGWNIAYRELSIGPLDYILLGDSLTDPSYPSCSAYWALALAMAPGCLIRNSGVTTETVAQIRARTAADVVAKMRPGRDCAVVNRAGTNGPGGSGVMATEYQALVDAQTAEAQIVESILLAIPPKGLSGNGATFQAYNATISGIAAANPSRLTYIEDSNGLGDGSYNAVPTYYVDAESANPIHPRGVGAYTQALVQYPTLTRVGRPDPRVTTGDNYTDNPASNQWVRNPLMAGTTTATNWTVEPAGSGTSCTPSIVASGDANATPWQRMTIGGFGATGHTCTIKTTLGHPAISASGFPARLELVADVRFNSLDCTNLDKLSIYMQQGSNVPVQAYRFQMAGIVGTISHTCMVHFALERDLSQSFSASTIVLFFELSSAGSAGAIGSIDVRNVSVTALAT